MKDSKGLEAVKTLVYGLGESGVAATHALLASGETRVVAADAGDNGYLRDVLGELGVEGRLGAGPEVLEGVGRVVVSPGIAPRDAVLAGAKEQRIPVVSELALGLSMLGSDVRVAAVTGTNGKTTVVDMLRHILDVAGAPHAVAGNSWRALTGCLEEVRSAGTLVLEVSSFQLHYLGARDVGTGFEVAALLNVRPDHLNWHDSLEEYAEDKLRIFEGQNRGDLALVSAADTVGYEAHKTIEAETLVVGGEGTEVKDGHLLLRGRRLISSSELRFAGVHNLENALFAAAAAQKLDAPVEYIRDGLRESRLKPHRLETVADREDVLYVDDSKATNPAAVAAALESFERPVVLILGGSEKYTDFAEILPRLGRCRAVVCQGEAGQRISDYLNSVQREKPVYLAPGLEEAVSVAGRISCPGDVVLLSPGCASFDQFSGYAERGEYFARLASTLPFTHKKVADR